MLEKWFSLHLLMDVNSLLLQGMATSAGDLKQNFSQVHYD